jgi:hypothetical protein
VGTVTLRLRVTGYNREILQAARIATSSSLPPLNSEALTKEFDFSLYPNVKLLPSKVMLLLVLLSLSLSLTHPLSVFLSI